MFLMQFYLAIRPFYGVRCLFFGGPHLFSLVEASYCITYREHKVLNIKKKLDLTLENQGFDSKKSALWDLKTESILRIELPSVFISLHYSNVFRWIHEFPSVTIRKSKIFKAFLSNENNPLVLRFKYKCVLFYFASQSNACAKRQQINLLQKRWVSSFQKKSNKLIYSSVWFTCWQSCYRGNITDKHTYHTTNTFIHKTHTSSYKHRIRRIVNGPCFCENAD